MSAQEELGEQHGWEVLATNLRVQDALLDVIELLEGIPVVVFKGPSLTQMIYGDLRRRASADNDIWVRPSDINLAVERLLRAGYRPLRGLSPTAAISRVGQVDLFCGSAPAVDLHAFPFSSRFFSVESATIESRLRTVTVGSKSVQAFDEALSFVHMVAHFVQHHFEMTLLKDIQAAWQAWGQNQKIRADIIELAPKTCTTAALDLTFRLIGDALHRTEFPTGSNVQAIQIPSRLFSMSERVRSGIVYCYLSRGEARSSLALQFLALFLVAPGRLPEGVWGATLLDHDDLVSRYGSGRYEVLLLRHMWRKLSD